MSFRPKGEIQSQIAPLRIHRRNQCILLLPAPLLDLLLALQSDKDIAGLLEVHQGADPISPSNARHYMRAMLMQAARQIGGHAVVRDLAMRAGEDIYEIALV